ncbi:MAG: T9SS type A sorting domain-containing protein [Bacteroidia bacterium]
MKDKMFFTAIIILFNTYLLTGQWTQSDEPQGGMCWSIEQVGNEIWTGYNYGVYVSTNDGATWTHHPTIYSPTMDIHAFGDTIILLQQGYTAPFNYRMETVTSFDGGLTWGNPVTAETDNSYYLWGERKIYVNDSALIMSSNSETYYSSVDFGQSWDSIFLPGMWHQITAIGKNFITCYGSDTISSVNYYSDDGGNTWNFLDSNYVSGNALIIDSTFYFSTGYTDSASQWHYFIARTSDFGLTWDTLAFDLHTAPGQLQFFNNKINYTFYYTNPINPVAFESTDGGNTWNPSSVPVELFWVDEDRSILLSNWEWLLNMGTSGLYRYNDVTGVYYHTETGIKAHGVVFLRANNGALFATADGKTYTSYDAGATYSPVPSFVAAANFSFKGDTIVGFTTSTNYNQKISVSYDNGHTWDSIVPVSPYWNNPFYILQSEGKIYIHNNYYVSVSNDWGQTWDSLSMTLDSVCGPFQYSTRIKAMAVCNKELFIVDQNNRVIAKLDTVTQSWKWKTCITPFAVSTVLLVPLGTKILYSSALQFLVSADSGNTWYTPARNGYPTGQQIRSITEIDGVWFSPCLGDIYYSFDSGDNWQQLATNFDMMVSTGPEGSITSLNEILYAGGNNVWRNNDTLQLISGNVFFDDNNNGIKDTGEEGISGIVLHTYPNNIAFNTDSLGNYAFLTAAVGDTLQPSVPTNFCSVNPPYYLTNGAASNADFGIYFFPGIQDLAVDITNRCPFRPGFNTLIDVSVSNYGTVEIPSQLEVVLDTSLLFINASVSPVQINGDTLIFAIDTLRLLESEIITIETETPFTVPLATPIVCSAAIFPLTNDTVPVNNYSEFSTTVIGSFDPNDKSALAGQYFTPTQVQNGEEMVYTIRFQNTGGIPADNIHITDSLSYFFDISSFRVISSSHAMYFTVEGNGILNFYFDNIFLPPAITDEPGSHGFVKFALKCKPSASLGDAIDNTAYIYFDFNPPIETNTVTTIIAEPPFNLHTEEIINITNVTVYPNPANNILNGTFDSDKIKSFTLIIYNPVGEVISTSELEGSSFKINVSGFRTGLYYGKIFVADLRKQFFFRFVVMK